MSEDGIIGPNNVVINNSINNHKRDEGSAPGSLSRRGADPSSRSSWPELLVSWETRFGGGRSHSRAEYTACYLFFLTGDRSLQENKEKPPSHAASTRA